MIDRRVLARDVVPMQILRVQLAAPSHGLNIDIARQLQSFLQTLRCVQGIEQSPGLVFAYQIDKELQSGGNDRYGKGKGKNGRARGGHLAIGQDAQIAAIEVEL